MLDQSIFVANDYSIRYGCLKDSIDIKYLEHYKPFKVFFLMYSTFIFNIVVPVEKIYPELDTTEKILEKFSDYEVNYYDVCDTSIIPIVFGIKPRTFEEFEKILKSEEFKKIQSIWERNVKKK